MWRLLRYIYTRRSLGPRSFSATTLAFLYALWAYMNRGGALRHGFKGAIVGFLLPEALVFFAGAGLLEHGLEIEN